MENNNQEAIEILSKFSRTQVDINLSVIRCLIDLVGQNRKPEDDRAVIKELQSLLKIVGDQDDELDKALSELKGLGHDK